MHVPIKRPERRTGDCDANERFQIDQTRVGSMSRDLLPPLYCPVPRRCRIIGRRNAATPRGTGKLISSSFRMNPEDNKNPNSPSGRKFIARRVVKPGRTNREEETGEWQANPLSWGASGFQELILEIENLLWSTVHRTFCNKVVVLDAFILETFNCSIYFDK